MQIQMRQGTIPAAGQGFFWILSCNLYGPNQGEFPAPTVLLCIKHDYSTNKEGESDPPKTVLCHHGVCKIVVTEKEIEEMAIAIQENEDVSDLEADELLAERYVTDEYCRVAWGWDPLKKSKEMWKRWQAIKLLVTPAVTM